MAKRAYNFRRQFEGIEELEEAVTEVLESLCHEYILKVYKSSLRIVLQVIDHNGAASSY